MEEVVQQLREELYGVAKKKLVLEETIKTMNSQIRVLKKELERRVPPTFY